MKLFFFSSKNHKYYFSLRSFSPSTSHTSWIILFFSSLWESLAQTKPKAHQMKASSWGLFIEYKEKEKQCNKFRLLWKTEASPMYIVRKMKLKLHVINLSGLLSWFRELCFRNTEFQKSTFVRCYSSFFSSSFFLLFRVKGIVHITITICNTQLLLSYSKLEINISHESPRK